MLKYLSRTNPKRIGTSRDPAISAPNPKYSMYFLGGQTYVDLYRNVNLENRQHYRADFGLDVFAKPQVVKLGVAVNF